MASKGKPSPRSAVKPLSNAQVSRLAKAHTLVDPMRDLPTGPDRTINEAEIAAQNPKGTSRLLKGVDVVFRASCRTYAWGLDNIPEPGIPESFKVLLKELQSLGLDVRVLREDNTEVEIMETVDYSDTDYRYEMEGDSKGYNYKEEENLGKMGYQKQEFDSEKQELVNADDDYTEDAADDGFEESFDEE